MVKIIIRESSSDLPTEKELSSLRKEDYILLIRRRKLPYTSSSLWSMKVTQLIELLSPLGDISTNLSREDIEYIELKRNRRKAYGKFNLEEIKQLLLEHDLPVSSKTKNGMIDTLLEDIKKSTFGFKPDPDQQAAIDRCYSKELVINAGPGSGKTSTLCYMASKIHNENKDYRVLILIYNKKAEVVLLSRLKYLKCNIINKRNAFDPEAKGICVVTFDKFGHSAVKTAGKYVQDKGYRLTLELSIPIITTLGNDWNHLILDEAQDILQLHQDVIKAIKDSNRNPLCICHAGDPRQEIYSSAVYFSTLWRDTPEENKQVLRYNHRSSKVIVNLLNEYSRVLFPTLHHDQIVVRKEKGDFKIYLNEDPIKRGEMVGKLVSDAEPGEAYALSLVSLDKFVLNKVTNTARQVISELRPGVLINIFSDYTAYSYDMATVKKMKGTEKSTVVVYGVELDYSLVIDEIMARKLLFVAISRAMNNLYLVANLSSNHLVKERLAPIFKCGGIKQELKTEIRYKLPSFSVGVTTSLLGCESGLSSCNAISVKPMRGDITASMRLETDLGADFIGHYSEALILKSLGIDLPTPDNIVVNSGGSYDLHLFKRKDIFILETISSKVETYKQIISDCRTKLSFIEGKDEAYFYATLKYSFEIGKLWTVTKELLGTSLVAQYNASKIASYIKKNTIGLSEGGKLVAWKQYSEKIYFRRGGTDKPYLGTINYIPDLIAFVTSSASADGKLIPIELKHTLKLTEQYRRQAGIYACLSKSEYCLLINASDGKVENIKATDYQTTMNTARAILAIRLARRQVLGPLSTMAILPPKNLNYNCIVSVDIETSGTTDNLITEIGAVAFSVTDFTVLGVYDKRPACVREMTEEEVTLSDKYYDTETDFTQVEKLTGLIVTDKSSLPNHTKALMSDFSSWMESISSNRTIFHWGGCEDRLFGHLGPTHDVRNGTFIPWLSNNGFPRTNMTGLEIACSQIVPHYKFKPHRAVEDAISTCLVFLAATSFSGVV